MYEECVFLCFLIYGLSLGFQCLKGAATVPIEPSWSCRDQKTLFDGPQGQFRLDIHVYRLIFAIHLQIEKMTH